MPGVQPMALNHNGQAKQQSIYTKTKQTMTAQQLQDKLIQLNACEPAIEWAKDKDLNTAWNTCERGDWMIWLLTESKNEVTDQELRLIAVECCRSVQRLMTDQRSINAVDVAERYANGEATDEELRQAQAAAGVAWDAAGAAAWEAREAREARAAAWAAAAAAWDAARAAAEDAGVAAREARAAAWEAREARAAAWEAESKKQSDIVRKIVPNFKLKQ